jgi:hypothetical protein
MKMEIFLKSRIPNHRCFVKIYPVHDILLSGEGERIYTDNVGEKILNLETERPIKKFC